MKFPTKDLFSKSYQMSRKLRIWSHLMKKSLVENFIFCAVSETFCCPNLVSPVFVDMELYFFSHESHESKVTWSLGLNTLTSKNALWSLTQNPLPLMVLYFIVALHRVIWLLTVPLRYLYKLLKKCQCNALYFIVSGSDKATFLAG